MNQRENYWDSKSLRSRFVDDFRDRVEGATLDAVARMIVEIDRPEEVMEVGVRFLSKSLAAGRVDVGLGAAREVGYEADVEFREDEAIPSILGLELPNGSEVLQRVWRSAEPIAYDDVARNPLVEDLRDAFAAVESKAMLAQRLDYRGKPFGVVCVDEVERGRTWSAGEQRFVQRFCEDFFAPLLHFSRRLSGRKKPSPAELEAVRLAARGLSYKEIAAELGKSIRTVEFQLRSARQKTGAANIVDLVRQCEPWL